MTVGPVHGVPECTEELRAPGRHGDADTGAGLIDFAVNVRGDPPAFLRDALVSSLADVTSYPGQALVTRAITTIADLHGRDPAEVMLLAGAADGFEALPRLGATHAALIQPSFTEPEMALRAAGTRISQVVLPPPWVLRDTDSAHLVPPTADLVVLGNPTNPTSVLHPRAAIEAMRRPGRIIVVDEAFADLTTHPVTGRREPESLAGVALPDVVVIRSVTKTFGLAGLRAGYLLAPPHLVERLSRGRRPWPVSTPALVALAECCGPDGRRYTDRAAEQMIGERAAMVERLTDAGVAVCTHPAAPFVLVAMPNGLQVRQALRDRGFAVRSCANFVGLTDDHLRLAVRPAQQVDALLDALTGARKEVGDGTG
ncbi:MULTISPECIES: Rv2231c family pyridoxal phosphate-dependent protein CobC [unclassified Gordonia (in: high G+C Gram-positive bacteria)]